MDCVVCRRNLKDDSRYCDFCGTKVPETTKSEADTKTIDMNIILKWIFISIVVTVAITLIARGLGLPILFGGLFLPFFFKRAKKQQ